MRSLVIFIIVILVYYGFKSIVRSALQGYRQEERRTSAKGEEMVLDPECRTYVIKDRAISKRISGTVHYFCSEACAERYEQAQRR